MKPLCGRALARAAQIGIVLAALIFSNSAFAGAIGFSLNGNGTEILSLTSPPPAGDALQVELQVGWEDQWGVVTGPPPVFGISSWTDGATVTLFDQNGVNVLGYSFPLDAGEQVFVYTYGLPGQIKAVETGSIGAGGGSPLPSDTAYLVISNTEGGSGFWAGGGPTPDLFTVNDTLDAVGFDVASSVTPLPATFPLFATGIGGLGLLGWRRKRKARAKSKATQHHYGAAQSGSR
jgi:hypothetical protein